MHLARDGEGTDQLPVHVHVRLGPEAVDLMKRIPEAEAAVVFVDRTGEITRVGFLGGGSRGRGFRGRGAPRGNLRPQYTEYDGKSHGGLEVRNLRDHEAAMVLALRESLRSNEQSM